MKPQLNVTLAGLVTLFALAASGTGCTSTQGRHDIPGLPNFGTVAEETLANEGRTPQQAVMYRGAQPTEPGFRTLAREYGVRAVIDFRREPDLIIRERDIVFRQREPGTGERAMEFISIPTNFRRPRHEQVVEFLKTVRRLASEGKPMFVHCQFGRDRTGMYVAAYRMVEQGWTLEQAMAELKGYGHNSVFCPDIDRYLLRSEPLKLKATIDKDSSSSDEVARAATP